MFRRNAYDALEIVEARCLRPGDKLLVTSDTHLMGDASTFTIASVDEVAGEVFLNKLIPKVLPTLAGPYEPLFAVEVALLSRDVVFYAEPDPADYHGNNFVDRLAGDLPVLDLLEQEYGEGIRT